MQTHVSFRNTEATQYFRTLVDDRLEKLSRFYDRIDSAQVTVVEEGLTRHVDVRLSVPGPDLVCSEKGTTHEEALDRCVESLRRSLVKRKEQQRSHDATREAWH